MEFNFGDKVKITDKISEHYGKVGKVVDILRSSKFGRTLYNISFGDSEHSERAYYREYSLEPYAEEDIEDLYYEFEVAGNVVIARLFDGNGNELQRGHGHIIHEGIKGFTQAASYALKKIFEKYNGGQLK
jgi:hypothetical protein